MRLWHKRSTSLSKSSVLDLLSLSLLDSRSQTHPHSLFTSYSTLETTTVETTGENFTGKESPKEVIPWSQSVFVYLSHFFLLHKNTKRISEEEQVSSVSFCLQKVLGSGKRQCVPRSTLMSSLFEFLCNLCRDSLLFSQTSSTTLCRNLFMRERKVYWTKHLLISQLLQQYFVCEILLICYSEVSVSSCIL